MVLSNWAQILHRLRLAYISCFCKFWAQSDSRCLRYRSFLSQNLQKPLKWPNSLVNWVQKHENCHFDPFPVIFRFFKCRFSCQTTEIYPKNHPPEKNSRKKNFDPKFFFWAPSLKFQDFFKVPPLSKKKKLAKKKFFRKIFYGWFLG